MRIVLLGILLFQTMVMAGEFTVIANKHFPLKSINAHQLKQIYLKRIHYIKDTELFPINFPVRNRTRQVFEEGILHMSQRQLKQHWTKAHYQGKRPPMVKHSVQSMIALVREVNGAIAYIPQSKVPSDLLQLYPVKGSK